MSSQTQTQLYLILKDFNTDFLPNYSYICVKQVRPDISLAKFITSKHYLPIAAVKLFSFFDSASKVVEVYSYKNAQSLLVTSSVEPSFPGSGITFLHSVYSTTNDRTIGLLEIRDLLGDFGPLIQVWLSLNGSYLHNY